MCLPSLNKGATLPYLTLPSVEIVNSRQVLSGSVPMLVSSIAEEGVKLTVHV